MLKILKGSKLKQFILFIIVTIVFSVSSNFIIFVWFTKYLQALIDTNNDIDTV